MFSLEEALNKSLDSKATAITDTRENFRAERHGRWIKIFWVDGEDTHRKYFGYNSIDDVPTKGLPLGWIPNKPGVPLEHLAQAAI